MLTQSPPSTALVLDLCTVVLPPHRHILRTSLAHYLGDLRHLSTCRVGDLPETAPASEPRWHRLRSCPRISLCYVDWHPSYQGDCLFYSRASVLVRERRAGAAVQCVQSILGHDRGRWYLQHDARFQLKNRSQSSSPGEF